MKLSITPIFCAIIQTIVCIQGLKAMSWNYVPTSVKGTFSEKSFSTRAFENWINPDDRKSCSIVVSDSKMINAIFNGNYNDFEKRFNHKIKKYENQFDFNKEYCLILGRQGKKQTLYATVLYFAVLFDRPAIAKLILEVGLGIEDKQRRLNIDHPDSTYKFTPLFIAIMYKRLHLSQLLLHYKANPNVQDYTGATPLMYAAVNSDHSMVNLLLFNNAQTQTKTYRGQSAASCATDEITKNIFKTWAKPQQN